MNAGDIVLLFAFSVLFVGVIFFLVAGFRQGFLWGLGCLFLLPIALLFLVIHWDVARRGFFIQMASIPIYLIGMFMEPGRTGQFLVNIVIFPADAIQSIIPGDILHLGSTSREKSGASSGSTPQTPGAIRTFGVDTEGMDALAQGGSPQRTSTSIAQPGTPQSSTAGTAQQPVNDGSTVISTATRGETAKLLALLAGGADIHMVDTNQWTALMHAANKGHLETVQTLLDNGANVNAQEKSGWTALTLAAYNGNAPTVQALVSKGANINITTQKGTTALITAAGKGHAEIVRILLDAGADINNKDLDGKTALQYATDRAHFSVVELLKKAGAKGPPDASPSSSTSTNSPGI